MKHQADNSRSEWRYCPYRMPKNKTEDVTLRVLPPRLHALTVTLYSQLSTLSRDQYAMNRAECLRQRSPAQTDLTLQWAYELIRLIAQSNNSQKRGLQNAITRKCFSYLSQMSTFNSPDNSDQQTGLPVASSLGETFTSGNTAGRDSIKQQQGTWMTSHPWTMTHAKEQVGHALICTGRWAIGHTLKPFHT